MLIMKDTGNLHNCSWRFRNFGRLHMHLYGVTHVIQWRQINNNKSLKISSSCQIEILILSEDQRMIRTRLWLVEHAKFPCGNEDLALNVHVIHASSGYARNCPKSLRCCARKIKLHTQVKWHQHSTKIKVYVTMSILSLLTWLGLQIHLKVKERDKNTWAINISFSLICFSHLVLLNLILLYQTYFSYWII